MANQYYSTPIPKSEKEQIHKLRSEGNSIRQIAKAVKRSQKTVINILKDYTPTKIDYCAGCRYQGYVGQSGGAFTKCCDYLLITGKVRSKICGPGKDCTVREERVISLDKSGEESVSQQVQRA